MSMLEIKPYDTLLQKKDLMVRLICLLLAHFEVEQVELTQKDVNSLTDRVGLEINESPNGIIIQLRRN